MATSELLYPLLTNYQSGQFATGSGTSEYWSWGTTRVEWTASSNSTSQVSFNVDFSRYFKIEVDVWCNSMYSYSNMQKVTCGNYTWGNSSAYQNWSTSGQKTITLTKANTGLTTGTCKIILTRVSGNNGYVQARLTGVRGYQYIVSSSISPSGSGSVSGEGNYAPGAQCSMLATPISGYSFGRWIDSNDVELSTDNPYVFEVNQDTSLIANFNMNYQVSLIYNSQLGSASWSIVSGLIVSLTATLNQDVQFKGWYANSVKITDNLSCSYEVNTDTIFEARFEPIYVITDSINGNGSLTYTRGVDKNDIEFNTVPSDNWHFIKYLVNGQDEYLSTPLVLHAYADMSIIAYFEEDDKFTVRGSSNIPEASIYISETKVYAGTSVTIYARPLADYYFSEWNDGSTLNPRQIIISSTTTVYATYRRMPEDSTTYVYRAYVKDQLHLTDPPKSFLKVDSFDVKTDLLTNANTTITVLEEKLPENINDGDILVVYDPRGTTLYQGVIKSMQDKQIVCSQMQSFYKGNWVFNHHSSSTTLEAEIAYLLGQYAQGKMYGSSWTDTLVAQRLGGITIQYEGSTSANLPTDYDYSIIDMEDFIYSLYEDYGIIFYFTINFSGANYVKIKVPSFDTIKVGDNMFAVQNMSPITTTEETNKLIIYSSNNSYRTTYIATTNGIVQTPSTNANRFNITNTVIVFSDDSISDIVAANLPSTMYNHKLTFDLLIKNFIYEFGEFNLGGALDVWHGEDYYSTVLTGYQIRKEAGKAITGVTFTCGKVRTALTKKLTMGVVK